MSEDSFKADYDALNDLVVNCPEFAEFEARLGDFNLFSILRSEFSELKHSNVLAWLFDPAQSHGLDDLFLQKWLMRSLHNQELGAHLPVSPVDVDTWELRNVEIRREWKHIDLLLILDMVDGERWVVCIENKVHSSQHSDQLERYRRTTEHEFPDVDHRLYIFLTKSDEEPEDRAYIPTTYEGVHKSLNEALALRRLSIGDEPRVLIDNYIRLLEEKFMNESDIARIARKIYRKHKRALDTIIDHRPDIIAETADELRSLIALRAEEHGIIPLPPHRNYVYFIPSLWDHQGNTRTTLPGIPRTLALEIQLTMTKVTLTIASWQNPEPWSSRIWQMASGAPFIRPSKSTTPPSGGWCHFHRVDLSIRVEDMERDSPAEIAERIFNKLVPELVSPPMQEILQILAAELPALDEAFRAEGR